MSLRAGFGPAQAEEAIMVSAVARPPASVRAVIGAFAFMTDLPFEL
jgi:hypothetical protein